MLTKRGIFLNADKFLASLTYNLQFLFIIRTRQHMTIENVIFLFRQETNLFREF